MAATLRLADEVATTAAHAGIRLLINWPTNWSPAYHHVKRLVDGGYIGSVWQSTTEPATAVRRPTTQARVRSRASVGVG